MAEINTTISLTDRMTAPLRAITSSVNLVLGAFEQLQELSIHAVNTTSFEPARISINRTRVELIQFQEVLRKTVEINCGILNHGLQRTEENIRSNENAQIRFNSAIHQGEGMAGKLFSKVKSLADKYVELPTIKQGVDFIMDSISAQDVQKQAETKLRNVMQQRMGSNQMEFQAILDIASTEQSNGVIGDEVQLAGSQQLATFLNTDDALKTLIPAMNNLAVEQNGVAVTQENIVSVGNRMGEAMLGQTSALSNVGIIFTEAEEKALKFGNEQERAAILAQVITNHVGEMNKTIAATPQGIIQQMKNDWSDVSEAVGAELYPSVMMFLNALMDNMPMVSSVLMGLADVISPVIEWLGVTGIPMVVTGIQNICSVASEVGSFVSENWSAIEPAIRTIISALLAYRLAMIAVGVIEGINRGIKIAGILATYAHAAATRTQVAANVANTASQMGLNTALLACPLTWIIIAIIALITVIFAVVAAINKFAGTSISAIGVICGAVNTAAAWIGNLVFGLINGVIGMFVTLWNFIISFANFFGNVFDDPVKAIAHLFFDLVDGILGLLQSAAEAIDWLFDSNLAEGVQGWRNNLNQWVDDTIGQQEEKYKKLNAEDYFVGVRKDYGEAWDDGYKAGEAIEDKIPSLDDLFGVNKQPHASDALSGMLPGVVPGGWNAASMPPSSSIPEGWNAPSMPPSSPIPQMDSGGISAGTGGLADSAKDTAANTREIADSVEISSEDLKYLRTIADREVVNRFTTAEVKISMKNENSIKSNMDIDSVVDYMGKGLEEALSTVAFKSQRL